MDAADWVSSSIAAVAAVTGIAALVVAVLSYNRSKDSIRQAKRSADQAERSADHAGEAVVEARRSADEAERTRELDEGRRADEKERWHRDHEPDLPGEIEAKLRRGGQGDAGALYGEIIVPGVYRVRADAVSGPASTQISLDGTTKANQPMKFMIERWAPGKKGLTPRRSCSSSGHRSKARMARGCGRATAGARSTQLRGSRRTGSGA